MYSAIALHHILATVYFTYYLRLVEGIDILIMESNAPEELNLAENSWVFDKVQSCHLFYLPFT